jgi:hypothetical protein
MLPSPGGSSLADPFNSVPKPRRAVPVGEIFRRLPLSRPNTVFSAPPSLTPPELPWRRKIPALRREAMRIPNARMSIKCSLGFLVRSKWA